jgi:hypothetical protein
LFGAAQSLEVRESVQGGVEAYVQIPFRAHDASPTKGIGSEDSRARG